MRLPAFGDVVSAAQRALTRFPFVILAGVVAAYAAVVLSETVADHQRSPRLLAAAGLGLPLFIGLAVLTERRFTARPARWAVQVGGIAAVAAFWLAWPGWSDDVRVARFLQLFIAFHLFVAFAPFVGRDEPRAFWQFNRVVLVRFLLAAIYTVVFWAGISGAFLAFDKLLGVPIASEAYARLWIVLAFVFNPWFFASGVPSDIGALGGRNDYPGALRVFAQYVLVPIVALYLTILTLYFAKVLVVREWPSGWIGYLVSGVGGVGMLAWLLVRPLEENPEQAWVRAFGRGFHLGVMPAIAMLWLAIWKRVHQYGVTERRYFLLVLSVWLAGVVVYYAVTRSRGIKLVPVTLCAVALLTFAGPWSAYDVARASQQARLEAILARNGLFADGALRPASGPVSEDDQREVGAILRYLLQAHGVAAVRPWLAGDVARRAGAVGGGTRARADAGARSIVVALGLRYIGESAGGASNRFSYAVERRADAVKIAGYSWAVPLSPELLRDTIMVSGPVALTVVASPPELVLIRDAAPLLKVALQPAIDSAAATAQRKRLDGSIPQGAMTIEASAGDVRVLVLLTQLAGTRAAGVSALTGIGGVIYLRLP